jgi:cytochrome c biogenesis protein CcdA/thiol-disulfide isomerase/thioredoxin
MLLFLVAYFGGVLTILSPCILPVLPFVFARSDQPFVKSGLPLLIGMALTFMLVATLAAVGGGWAVQANEFGRVAAIVLLAVFGVTLLFPQLADRITRPLVALGSRLSESASNKSRKGSSFVPSLLLGVATGLLWAPCAGPILGLVLTGAALQGASTKTSLLLLAYAAGAATSLAVALLIGGRVFNAMKRSLGAGEWIRRGIGAALLCGVVAISLGLDTGVLARLSSSGTAQVEQSLIDRIVPAAQPAAEVAAKAGDGLPIEGRLPPLGGAVSWINSPPLTAEGLRGKVVVVDFWTYSCINCLRSLPYVRAWAEKYKDQGLVVIGVHAPEFAFEKNLDNVRNAVKDLKLDYPVAVDNDYAIWKAFDNHYWPAHYFIDAQGRIRHHHYGEGDYEQSETVIRQLLAEAGAKLAPEAPVAVDAAGAQAKSDKADMKSPETYVGYERAEKFASIGGVVQDRPHVYTTPASLDLNQWGLRGDWTVGGQSASLDKAGGRVAYRFHARDLHLVLGPGADGKPVRFRVRIDGQPPLASHGVDVDAQGIGTIDSHRLYQLVRQASPVTDRLFEIEFLDPGAEAFAFTFG